MTLEELLPSYLGRQRWFAGGDPQHVTVTEQEWLHERLQWLLVEADGARYQLVLGYTEAMSPPEYLHGHDDALVGVVEDRLAFDAVVDGEFARALLARIAPDEEVSHVRPMGVEQSNTSVVFDDRLVLKLFRRLQDGPNPDVEVTAALAAVGYANVPAPVATWAHPDGSHLAVVQPYLAGGAEGWALALTSLRDFYASDCDAPGECGGDFAPEAARLGETTARLHLALAQAFGNSPGDAAGWLEMARQQLSRLEADDADRAAADEFLERLGKVGDAGRAIRVHGDYHLGQVLETDVGWYVLDFEGEPARPLAERTRPSSPFKDVAGMLRSLHYAAHVALLEREEAEREHLVPLASLWEERNRDAFLDHYLAQPGIGDLLPPGNEDRDVVLAAFELDKAVYEVLYERAHRPTWVEIPRGAIRRLLGG